MKKSESSKIKEEIAMFHHHIMVVSGICVMQNLILLYSHMRIKVLSINEIQGRIESVKIVTKENKNISQEIIT